MSHQALARKHRPRNFAEVATQAHVSETLRRAVATDRVGHAYLFCGPRGVGKTTLARVLAMALNCPDRSDEGEPCGVCDSCRRIWSGQTALDVVEIDAASNRGVDAARELRERAYYAPSEEGRYKVYIVDEAHMLTREAWNALLKILEEPPARVIFVFATTEPQKIQQSAAPILSRCQRFDFRRFGVPEITERLREVLERENAEAPDDALRMLARKADGGMRDALSLLDQVLALGGGRLDGDTVRRVLGLVDEERYLELLDILVQGRHGDVFAFVEALLDEGYDLVEFYHGLVEVLRIVLRLRLSGADALPELPDHLRQAYGARAGELGPGDWVRMLALASELESTGSLRRSAQPRLLVEMLLLRLSYLDRTVELEELLRGLGGAPAPTDPSASPGPPADGREEHSRGAGSGSGPRTADPPGTAPVVTSPATSEARSPAPAAPTPDPAAAEPPAPGGSAGSAPDAPPPKDPGPPEGAGSLSDGHGPPPPGADAAAALAWMLETGTGIPGGMATFLRAARAERRGQVVRLVVDAAAVERLEASPGDRTRLREGFERALSGTLTLELVASGPGVAVETGRITQDTVRKGRLKELVDQEPALGEAVQELDLELLD